MTDLRYCCKTCATLSPTPGVCEGCGNVREAVGYGAAAEWRESLVPAALHLAECWPAAPAEVKE